MKTRKKKPLTKSTHVSAVDDIVHNEGKGKYRQMKI